MSNLGPRSTPRKLLRFLRLRRWVIVDATDDGDVVVSRHWFEIPAMAQALIADQIARERRERATGVTETGPLKRSHRVERRRP